MHQLSFKSNVFHAFMLWTDYLRSRGRESRRGGAGRIDHLMKKVTNKCVYLPLQNLIFLLPSLSLLVGWTVRQILLSDIYIYIFFNTILFPHVFTIFIYSMANAIQKIKKWIKVFKIFITIQLKNNIESKFKVNIPMFTYSIHVYENSKYN